MLTSKNFKGMPLRDSDSDADLKSVVSCGRASKKPGCVAVAAKRGMWVASGRGAARLLGQGGWERNVGACNQAKSTSDSNILKEGAQQPRTSSPSRG